MILAHYSEIRKYVYSSSGNKHPMSAGEDAILALTLVVVNYGFYYISNMCVKVLPFSQELCRFREGFFP